MILSVDKPPPDKSAGGRSRQVYFGQTRPLFD